MTIAIDNAIKTHIYSGVNIRLHPHTGPELYIKLFNFIKKQRFAVPTGYKNNFISLQQVSYIPLDGKSLENGFMGAFIRYTDLFQAKWVNENTGEYTDKEELKGLIKIPANLKADGVIFEFVFYPMSHTLIVQIDNKNSTTTPNTILKFFESVFKSPEFIKNFKSGEVHTLKEPKGVVSIINNKRLKSIEFDIARPNPDDLNAILQRKVLKSLDDQNAKNLKVSMDAQQGKYLKLDKKSQALAWVAAENGSILAVESDQNDRTHVISTANISLEQKIPLPKSLSLSQKWIKVTQIIKEKIASAKKELENSKKETKELDT
ncbi:DUF4747 family protein [Acinetobacter baumannii]|nr:DUF4747 family protein [Acinetobacter baumannii]